MAGSDDLIVAAAPYLATEIRSYTAGTTWQWDYGPIKDSTGALVDMTSGFTGVGGVVDAGYSSIVALTVTFPASGYIRCKVLPAASVVAAGTYLHEVTITRTSDGAKFLIVGAGGARFVVLKKAT